jgi:hypothetical protein
MSTFSEWFLVESRDPDGVWRPVKGSGSSTREGAERTIASLLFMTPAAPKDTYRVALYVRDEDAL